MLEPETALETITPIVTAAPDASLPKIDGYEVVSLLGRGGMGRVYLAHDRSLARSVAIKMLIDPGNEALSARFQAESQAVARLQHPNIAQVFEAGVVDGQPYLVLEYLEGGSLAQKLAGKPQAPGEAARLLEILARAIEHSHQHHILHRDLKPANVLLAADGTPKITDFGLAKRLHEDARLTGTGEILGTPSYMAPEQASGVAPNMGPATDIYALGAMLYEMLTGRPPFQGSDAVQTLMMVLTIEPVPPSRLLPSVPRDLVTISMKCLEKSPRKRYPSALALADDLRRYLEHRPILARPVRWWERVGKWAKRRPAAAALLALLAASMIGLIAGLVLIQSANRRLQASNRETLESLRLARHAIDSMLVDLSEELAPTPQSSELRRKTLERARELYERLVALRPSDRDGRTQAADAFGKLGAIYNELGRLDDAEAMFRKALSWHTELQRDEPAVADHQRGRANSLLNLANLQRKRGRFDDAESLARSALAQIEPLLENPEPVTLRSAAGIHNTLALALRGTKKPEEAARTHEAALKLSRKWLTLEPKNLDAKIAVASNLSNKAGMLLASHPTDAIVCLSEAEQLLGGQTAPQLRFFAGQFQANRALAYEQLEMVPEAETAHAAALQTLAALVNDYPAVPGYRFLLAKEHLNHAALFGPRGRTAEGLRHAASAGTILKQLVAENPNDQQFRTEHARWRTTTGLLEQDLADQKKSQP